MPNFDAGHYFLTVLAPIRTDPLLRDGQSHSRRHLVKEALSAIPTGERTVASQGAGQDNPFARATRTHFARLFVLDDVVFNGRASGDSLLDRIGGVDPLVPQDVDRLSTPFLIFCADFDAANGADSDLRSYAEELWSTMRPEITEVFQHCYAFNAVKGPDAFYDYLKKCQVETTMPFNDYWSEMPVLHGFDVKPYLAGAGGVLALAVIAALVMWEGWPLLAGLAGLVLVVALGIRGVMAAARKPLPASPASAPQPDLPTVLKSLFVQRAFTAFAIQAQALRAGPAGDQALHDSFGAFLAATQPLGPGGPTQPPGVIGV